MAITRRQALIGAAVTGGAAFGLWGRYALGDTFEEHVADVLGIDRELADTLLASVKETEGIDYNARAAAFLFATTSPTRHLMPDSAKREAVEPLVTHLFELGQGKRGMDYGMPMTYAYAGLQRAGDFQACSTLKRTSS